MSAVCWPGWLTALTLVAACGAGPALTELGPGQTASHPAASLGSLTSLADGVLTYAVAPIADNEIVSVQLDIEFALIRHSVAPDGSITLHWRVPLGPPEYDITDLAIDHQRAEAWVASRDGTVRSYALADGQQLLTWHLGSSATAVAVVPSSSVLGGPAPGGSVPGDSVPGGSVPDGSAILTGTEDGVLCLRRRRDGALLQCVAAHDGPLHALAVDANQAVSGAWDGSLLVWSLPSMAIIAKRRFPGSINAVAIAPAGDRIAIARSARPPGSRQPNSSGPISAANLPTTSPGDEKSNPHAGANIITLWSPTNSTITQASLIGHRDAVTALAWTHDGTRLISGGWDHRVCLWDPTRAVLLSQSELFAGPIRDIASNARGAHVVVGAWSDPRSLTGAATSLLDLMYLSTRERAPSD